jgi:hypothetical protein
MAEKLSMNRKKATFYYAISKDKKSIFSGIKKDYNNHRQINSNKKYFYLFHL